MSALSTLEALVAGDEVRAPAPGWFHLLVAPDHLVAPGDVIGELEVLGRIVRITAPRVHGLVKLEKRPSLARLPVSFGDVLFRVATDVAIAGTNALAGGTGATTRAEAGLVVRAPTSGRFYGRPSPDKPAFVEAGRELAA
ncbi:MAG TPA: hypothetical protein VMZ53_15980, partial [Kofleriaceae bacterium]|nr:hypothetical protein [Kofleriaceae bacterium]